MQDEKKLLQDNDRIVNRNISDNGAKMIFEDPFLCSQLLKGYTGLELLKDVSPEDIEDVTERFIPMFTEQRDADVVKQVHLSEEDIFIALIEHKSGVDYNVIMQILRYIVYIWEDYEKRKEKLHPHISKTKGFKYPPVLPIVYYEGKEEWCAAKCLKERVALEVPFGEYIPDFRYLLISINKYGKEYLIKKRDELSLIMLINSIKSAEEFKNINLTEEYLSELFMNAPESVLTVIARVIAVVLRKQKVPEDEIQKLVDQIKERKHMGLFDDWEGFDVQKEREIGQKKGELKGQRKQILIMICKKLSKGKDVGSISEELDIPGDVINKVCQISQKYAPEYDVDKILDEVMKKKIQLI